MEILMQSMNDHVKSLLKEGGVLYRVNVTGEQLWDAYMSGFENDPVFRDPNSSVHNCNDCKHFIHRYANLVVLKDFEFKSIFDFPIPDAEKEEYEKSITAMLNLVKNAKIVSQFCMTTDDLTRYSYTKCSTKYHSHLGICKSVKRYTKEEADKYGVVKPNEVVTFNHFYLELPNNVFTSSSRTTSTALTAKSVADKESLVKTMEEFSTDTITTVIELIEQNAILNGSSYLVSLKELLHVKQEWSTTPKDKLELWYWNTSRKEKSIRGIRGSVMGTLLSDIESGMDLVQACKSWNVKVDPVNYKRAKSPITKTQIAVAQKFVEENGYVESFTRRCATMRDIEASEILHIHNSEKAPISIFDAVKTTTSNNNSKIDNAKEIAIEDFMKNILPSSTSVEVFFENKHKNNLVTLITAENKESKPIFQWSNNFSWTYIGNLSGKSQITQAVQKAGGVVDAPFRFSIMWNEDGRSIVDFDAHCVYNNSEHIYYGSKRGHLTKGTLDVDMIRPHNTGVENIYWGDLSTLKNGEYVFIIRNFDGGRNTGVKAELYTPVGTFSYEINKEVKEDVVIAKVEVKNQQIISIEHGIEPSIKSEEIYGLSTQQWHPVNLICLSPNYWQNNVGNKHYFFFIDGCKAEDSIRGFHNEFLCSDLTPHRKVLDVLAHTMQVKTTEDQLSGLGFNATVSDELIVRVKGSKNQIFKIKF